MLLPLLLLVGDTDPASVYNGRTGRLDVRPPRIEAELVVDGSLDETAWEQAAMLTGFSQFTPVDGVPAADSTEVLVWYSASAIHFGVRAFEAHGQVHATLADRDKIGADDYVQILLGTFDDGRQASVFAVNPFGVQSDGALVETGSTSGNGFNNAVVRRENADLSPDFVFESKGRLTEAGYEIEVMIPFKSLRFQPTQEQRWGINVTRQVQHSGAEDSWAPAKRASASFLAQSGHLVGLTELRRGLVLEFNPSLTSKATGAPGTNGWNYSGGGPELGGSLRWGVTNNLNLNATANPDFSQVESDAGQFLFDPRNELFFSEKRPFFLDGIEQFTTPSSLIYTRRIVQPVAAAKLTGKGLGTEIALLSAVDDPAVSPTGDDHPIYNLLRLQRDLGAQSRLGMVYTDRIVGRDFNRVAGVDARLLFGEVYSVNLQVAGSHTRTSEVTTTAPLWYARVARNGRTFGFRAQLNGSDRDFRARSGFFPRPGVSHVNVDPRVTLYGKPGSLIESVTGDLNLDGLYRYDQFATTAGMQEEKIHFNTNVRLRGGWTAGASVLIEQFGYPSEVYDGYRIEMPRPGGGADTVPFVGRPAIPNRDYVLQLDTPEFAQFSGNLFVLWGNDENFYEWASGDIVFFNAGIDWRPTDQVRLNGTYQLQRVGRRSDGSTVNIQHIPRLKVEYQVSRPIFLRVVGEYASERQDDLRDHTRTEAPLLIFDPGAGDFVRATAFGRKSFRGDLLFSYQPNPGTVLFAGYGSTLRDPVDPDDPLRGGLRRSEDGFFLKMSYLFRM
ncbi:MAG TPA: DUF5916 domain-containing protein [Gemmatimonadales bacterium]|nr:DUF5916 domain-containing protein [Gemmatimonadales bacterium]